jgi:hypothetical protein
MPQPTAYERQASYTSLVTADPNLVVPGTSLDADFNAVKTTLDETLSNLALIQKDDGSLRNGIVTSDSLASSLSIGFTFRGEWAASTAYIEADGVSRNSKFYICRADHTSSAPTAPELDSATWELAADFASIALDAVSSMILDTFSGDGSQTAFTLSSTPASEQNCIVAVDGVLQPTTSYTVASGILTFGSAPPAGTGNIQVRSFTTVSLSGAVAASLVNVSPTVAGGSNAQSALTNVYAAAVSAASAASAASASAATATADAASALAAANSAADDAATALTQATTSSVGTSRLDDGSVTFVKVAAAAIAGTTDATTGTSDSLLMTPKKTAEAIAALASAGASAGRLLAVTPFPSSGTWTKATKNPSFIVVEVIGAGGGGGGISGSPSRAMTGGGGAGGYSRKVIQAASLGATETVTVGVGGTAGSTSGGTGGTGGTSSFGSHATATGGAGGVGATTDVPVCVGGAAGAGASGDLNLSGNPGGHGSNYYVAMSSGGVVTTAIGVPGDGGGSILAGGGKAPSTGANGTAAGANSGAGGSGAYSAGMSRSGGAGGSGYVLVWEYA